MVIIYKLETVSSSPSPYSRCGLFNWRPYAMTQSDEPARSGSRPRDRPRVGFIGLGTMGGAMASNLLASGAPLLVWNRSPDKAASLQKAGAVVAQSCREVFDQSWAVLLMLSDEQGVDEVLDRQGGSFAERVRGCVIVNMGTFRPEYSCRLGQDVAAAGGRFVEASVSGSRAPAERGELIGMTAGEQSTVDEIHPLLVPICSAVHFCGAVPSALTMKLAVNIFLITTVTGLAEAFHFARRQNLDVAQFKDILDAGPMASAVSKMKGAKLATEDFSAHASIKDVLKNNQLIADAAHQVGASSPLVDACLCLYQRALDLGYAADDMAAVVRAFDGS